MIGPARKVFVRTFGCQMNQHDTGKLLLCLAPAYAPVSSAEEADLIIVNTCSIREKAEHKVYSYLGRLAAIKRDRPSLLIGVGGCVARQEGRRLLVRARAVDVVFGPHDIEDLPSLLEERVRTGRRVCRLGGEEDAWREGPLAGALPASAPPVSFVTIARGCDNFCAYCVVPLVRGREVSRPAAAVLAEARALVERGAMEIVLLGQNVNSWRGGPGSEDFVGLLAQVAAIPGLSRLRFVTAHPRDLTPALSEAMASLPAVCNHLHLPVQSGSSRILAAMRRGYTADEYLRKVDLLRALVPGIELTTDVIVGFPGETRREFEATIALLRGVRFQNAFAFRYSPRPGTAAASLPDLPEASDPAFRRDWLPELQSVQDGMTIEKHESLVGSTIEVLVEGRGSDDGGGGMGKEARLEGRTRDNYIVHFPGGSHLIGRTVKVRTAKARKVHLEGEIVA
jgi:tRNA-2-methylthio-N6-dimethylallyladenosine synthase